MVELLRLSIQSLNGVQYCCPCSNTAINGGVDCNKNNVHYQKNISAHVGFCSFTIPPQSLEVSSSAYSTLFHAVGSAGYDNNILAVCSEEVVVQFNNNSSRNAHTIDLNWHNDNCKTIASTNNNFGALLQKSTILSPNSNTQPATAHLEIELSRSENCQDNEIDLHICVCTSSCVDEQIIMNNTSTCTNVESDDENDCIDDAYFKRQDVQPQMVYGVANLKLSDLDDDSAIAAINNKRDNNSTTNSYYRQGGKVINLPIRRRELSPSDNTQHSNENILVEFAKNATLSVRLEIGPANHQLTQREQYHYIESEWRRDVYCSVPDSIIHNDHSIEEDAVQNDETWYGLSQLFRRATSTLTMKKSTAIAKSDMNGKQQNHTMVGKVITFSANEMERNANTPTRHYESSSDDIRQPKNLKNAKQKKQPSISEEIPKMSLSQTISDRFLCGAVSLPNVDSIGGIFRMVAAAGHHCDEDHVGLYIVDSESMSSSIATADAM